MGEEEDHHTREASQKINCDFLLAFESCRASLDPMQQDKIESTSQPASKYHIKILEGLSDNSRPIRAEQQALCVPGQILESNIGTGAAGSWPLDSSGVDTPRRDRADANARDVAKGNWLWQAIRGRGNLAWKFWLCNAWNLLHRGLHRYSGWQSVPEKLQSQMAPSG